MPSNPWTDFENDAFEIVDLGRPAVFLLPSHKLRQLVGETSVEDGLHRFLSEHFGAFTTTSVPYFGFWKNDGQRLVYDECRMYEVSFAGKDRLPELMRKLADIAALINEDCIYFKAGQYTCLIKPKKA